VIAILDYGIGNLKSIYNMFKKLGIESAITSNTFEIQNSDKYILPGVGSFDYAVNNLKKAPFFGILQKEVLINKKPILGICLGMQILTKGSEEGVEKGLGWIDAYTKKFDLKNKNFSIPHMGWNQINPKNKNNFFNNLSENRFYFVHSYHVVCNNPKNILATTDYNYTFTSAIYKENIFGVQFHPEKSHKFGLKLLNNFGHM
jgi:glutamine amidotransferase